MDNRAAAVRASVERGDPLAIWTDGMRRGAIIYRERVESALASGEYERALNAAGVATATDPPEPDPPQAVTADPQTLDTQPDGDYLDRVGHAANDELTVRGAQDVSHSMSPLAESDYERAIARTTAFIEAGGVRGVAEHGLPENWPRGREDRRESAKLDDGGSNPSGVFDRESFLARVQRIDQRERRP